VAAMPACAGQLPNADVMGAYRFDDGRLVSIRRSEGKTLRACFYESGKSRRLHPDGKLRFITGPDFTASEPLEAVIEFQRGDSGQIERMVWTPQDSPAMSASKVNRSEPVQFDSDGAVLDTDLQAIPGLYAAGELVGGLFYFNYAGGTGLMNGSVFGKIAGASAAAS